MVKTPEEYFQEQVFDLPSSQQGGSLTVAEQAFFHKYVDSAGAKSLGITPEDLNAVPVVIADEVPLEEELKDNPHLQMIFFYVQGQLYTVPIEAVQEVIKFTTPITLPLTPKHVAGVINLRGRVTPLLHLEQLLCEVQKPIQADSFIIVCQRKGIQIGLIVDKVHNMHTIQQEQISWNVEAQIGTNIECLCGILDYNCKIFGIISIDKIVDHVLQARDAV